MKLQGRDLASKMRGEDVALLQKELIQLGYKIAPDELKDKSFGKTTLDAVLDLQKKSNIKPTGIVDSQTAAVMQRTTNAEVGPTKDGGDKGGGDKGDGDKHDHDKDDHDKDDHDKDHDDKDHPDKFIVRGQVRRADGALLPGAIVKAFDKDLRSEQPLGKPATTDKRGQYEIAYTAKSSADRKSNRRT